MCIIIFLILIAALYYVLVYSEKKRINERQIKVNDYSAKLNEEKDRFIKEISKKYEDIIIKENYCKSNEIKTVDKVSIYSSEKKRGFEPQTIDIWVANGNLYILTNLNYLFDRINFYKNSMAECVGVEFYEVKNRLQEEYNNNEQLLIHKYCIDIDSIEYYLIEGDIYTSTSIYGGGGTVGGSSVTGAIMGGVIGGDTGALIGSRKEGVINDIRSNTTVHDEKYVIIKYKNSENALKEIRINKGYSEIYDVLKYFIPEKEYTYVMKNINERQFAIGNENSASDRLIELKKLYENELISQEEYDTKRAEILNML